MIRPLAEADVPTVMAFIASVGMLEPTETEEIRKRLARHVSGEEQALWFIHGEEAVEGVAYGCPEPMTTGTWNLLMLVVGKECRGKGVGAALVRAVENAAAARGSRLLIVETSSADDFTRAQRFYARCGFSEVARIPDFYDAGCDKIVFSKTPRPASGPEGTRSGT